MTRSSTPHPVDNRPKPRCKSSPKGTKLPAGKATRQSILDNLPGTARQIAEATNRNYSTICAAMCLLAKEGLIIEEDKTAPVEGGGTPQKVWKLPHVHKVPLTDPWYNAWYERAK